MKKEPLSKFVFFGTCVRYLLEVRQGAPYTGESFVKDNIRMFFRDVEDLGLVVTRNASYQLKAIQNELDEEKVETLTAAQAARLREIMKSLRFVVMAEVKSKVAYVVIERRYKPEKLLDEPASLFADGV